MNSKLNALLLCALGSCLLTSVSVRADVTSDQPAKPYRLFMGRDVAVPYGKDFAPIVGVNGGVLHVAVGRQRRDVARAELKGFRVDDELKISDKAVEIEGLKIDRGYGPLSEPELLWRKNTSDALQVRDLIDYSGDVARHETKVWNDEAERLERAGGIHLAEAKIDRDKAAAIQQQADQLSRVSAVAQSAEFVDHSTDVLGREDYDALVIDFTVSSPTNLPDAYVILFAEFHPSKKKTIENFVHIQEISVVGNRPQRVNFKAAGLPAGFELVKTEVHLYSGGREVATNVSANSVTLSRDEAFDYIFAQYLNSHRTHDGQVNASVALAQVPSDIRAKIPKEELGRRIRVHVSAKGLPTEIQTVDGTPLSDYSQQVIREFRFKPALTKGKAVDGECVVKLQDGI